MTYSTTKLQLYRDGRGGAVENEHHRQVTLKTTVSHRQGQLIWLGLLSCLHVSLITCTDFKFSSIGTLRQ